ncbi:ATP-binding protein [Sphingobacterium sp. ML3W]|uniref:tetratricopeptide repeat-containing sensor histidine kinase n=1 Tax=Sphingobacterium sp. ML3W TaxID=1538644 RepID=UPI00249AC2CD|nr:ATP-binding protein [Sphingobacterium sp. ML3W]WFA79500.1 ATP-binding protein [Sphingobacterium sp. ML3W]
MQKSVLLLLFTLLIFSCSRNKDEKIIKTVNNDYDKAFAFFKQGQKDSSFFYFELAKDQYLNSNDSLGTARCLVFIGLHQYDEGDFFGAQETSLSAIRFIGNKQKDSLLCYAYNTIANASDEMNQYDQAIPYYQLAIKYSFKSINTLIYKNNLAVCLRNAKRYSESIKLSTEIISKVTKGTNEYAKFLNNLAKTKWMADPSYNPVPWYQKALEIRIKQKDLWGQNSSYASLAKYYDGKDTDSSIYYLNKQYKIALEINSPDDELNALRGLIQSNALYSERYLQRYLALNDSIQQARAAAKNQFALIRYEVEKNKTENLRLEKENAQKQYRLTRQRVITGTSVFLLLLVIGGGTFWYKRRKQRLELEAENKVKETQLHLSKKIHDVVANGIYRVMSEIEYKEDIDREGMLDKLEHMYNQSRDISHDVEQKTITEIPYSEQIAELLKSFAADHRRVFIAGNETEQWTNVGKRIKDEIKHVLQELMVNMKKHSQADQVVVRFETSGQQLKIVYKDNGIGMPQEKTQGKGLSNTVSRIESLGGEIIFVSELGKGLSVTTNIPLV